MSKFKPKKVELKKTKEHKPKSSNINVRVEPELFGKFKMYCKSRNITVTDALTQMMSEQIELKTA